MNAPIFEREGSIMAEQENKEKFVDLQKSDDNNNGQNGLNQYDGMTYLEETAGEIAAPNIGTYRKEEDGRETEKGGTGIGIAALILSIVSLFVLPILFGGAGIVCGFIARRSGARGLGNWAIGIGAASILIGMFIAPFMRVG